MTSRKDATATAWSDYAALLHDSAAPGDAFALTTALAAAAPQPRHGAFLRLGRGAVLTLTAMILLPYTVFSAGAPRLLVDRNASVEELRRRSVGREI